MIPPYVLSACASPAERALFSKFREDPASGDWVVIHSLGISRHPSRLAGELDFLVIIPGHGVLCIEAKGGHVSRNEGVWTYGTGVSAQTSLVGPFRQAADGMHAIRRHVARRDASLRGLLFFSAVFFTGIDFDELSAEWFPWQVVDRTALSHRSLGECCLAVLTKAHQHMASVPSAKWYDPTRSRPRQCEVDRLVEILRGDFECPLRAHAALEDTEHAIALFTEEQFSALDVLAENRQVLFKGPAGTGKTFLAVEAAQRAVVAGQRTILCCFNRLLGLWLDDNSHVPAHQTRLLTAGTLHRIMLELAALPAPASPDPGFWATGLPERLLEMAADGRLEVPLFDVLILDEAQDLLFDQYLDVLDALLAGGLKEGRWIMFGDLERQAIYRQEGPVDAAQLQDRLRSRAPHHFIFPLRVNCRNTAQIAAGVEIVCRLVPGYSRVLRPDGGPDLDVRFMSGSENPRAFLHATLRELCSTYKANEIVVLSSKEDRSSCAGLTRSDHPDLRLTPLRHMRPDHPGIAFTTVYAFKGLEAPIVILTDLDRLDSEQAVALLYVGMSRARHRLVLILPDRLRDHWLSRTHAGFISQAHKRGP